MVLWYKKVRENIEKERRSHKFCNHIYGMFHMNVNKNIRKLLSLMLCCTCSVPVFPGGTVTDGSIFAVQGNSPEEGREEESKNLILNMQQKGYSLEVIADVTNKNIEQIKTIIGNWNL